MDNYYEPDDRWEMYGITNKEQFEQQFVVKGYYHDGVPTDVKDAFTSVEYLLAHSYYFWPMYDEAFNKALRILEMAVKMKAKQLEIQLDQITKNGKRIDKKLVELIDQICDKPYLIKLKQNLDRARNIRNNQMHPDRNSYMGGVGGLGQNIKLFVNVLNELFRDNDWQLAQFERQQAIEEKLKSFENSLLVLENNAPGILISGILGFKILNETLFLVLNPVLRNVKKTLEEHKYSNPIAITFSKFKFQEEYLIGTSVDGHEIKIYKTNKVENILQLANHIKEFSSVSQTDRALYEAYINNEALWSLVKLEYNYLSKNLNQLCYFPNLTV